MPLSDEQRNKLKKYIFDSCMSNMFGDGLEADYIRDGISFKGINNMSDEELLEEAGYQSGEEDVAQFLVSLENEDVAGEEAFLATYEDVAGEEAFLATYSPPE